MMDYSAVIYWISAILTILVIIFGDKWFDWMVKRKTQKLMAQRNSENQSLPIRTKNSQKNVFGSHNTFHGSTISQSITSNNSNRQSSSKTTDIDNTAQSNPISFYQLSADDTTTNSYTASSVYRDDYSKDSYSSSSSDRYSSSDSYSGGGGDTGGGGSSGDW